MDVVEQEYSQRRNHAKHDDDPFGDGRVDDTGEGEASHNDTSHDQQGPSDGAERVQQTVALDGVGGLEKHRDTDVGDTDQDREQHLRVIACNRTLDHAFLDPVRNPGGRIGVHSEECVQDGSHHDGRDTEGGDERSHRADESLGLPHHESDEREGDTIARVTHTHGEEEGEEYGDARRRVELVVGRTAVHVGQNREHLHELVLLEFDRRIVILHCLLLEIDDVHLVELGAKGRVILHRSEADESCDQILGGLPSTCVSEVQLKGCDILVALAEHFRNIFLQLLKPCLAGDDPFHQGSDLPFGGPEIPFRSGAFLDRQ